MEQHTGPTAQPADEMAQLRAEEKALRARMKELRAQRRANRPAKPTPKTLEQVIAAQAAQASHGDLRWLASQTKAR